jgi:hypothetical protein
MRCGAAALVAPQRLTFGKIFAATLWLLKSGYKLRG